MDTASLEALLGALLVVGSAGPAGARPALSPTITPLCVGTADTPLSLPSQALVASALASAAHNFPTISFHLWGKDKIMHKQAKCAAVMM